MTVSCGARLHERRDMTGSALPRRLTQVWPFPRTSHNQQIVMQASQPVEENIVFLTGNLGTVATNVYLAGQSVDCGSGRRPASFGIGLWPRVRRPIIPASEGSDRAMVTIPAHTDPPAVLALNYGRAPPRSPSDPG